MKNLIFKSLLIVLMLLSACSKPLKASFQAVEDSIQEGRVSFTYTGDPGTSYFWDFGDGQTSSERSPVHFYSKNGTYFPKVVVKNKNDDPASSSSTVSIVNVRGTFGFYLRHNIGQTVYVHVDGNYIGAVTKYITSGQPYCETDGFAWGRFTEGIHRVEAKKADGSKLISGTFNVISGKCAAAQLD